MLDSQSPFGSTAPPGPDSRNNVALQRIRRALIGCEIAPGAYFNEADIAERFGLGRAAVRGALASLAPGGLVASHPRQGWRTAAITAASIGDIIDARRRLEPALTETQPSPADARQLQSLALIASAGITAADQRALSTARSADRQILDLLASTCRPSLRRWLGEIWDHSARLACRLEQLGVIHWPVDRQRLIVALAARDQTTARAEIERDIAQLEAAALRGLVVSDVALHPPSAQRSARRRRKTTTFSEIIVSQPTIERR